jgi:alkylation response protein AidB-like acyl-CoA dehydrogenase
MTMESLTSALAETIPWMQSRAEELDREAAFPRDEIDILRRLGALEPPLAAQASAGDGNEADQLAAMLSLIGQGNLSVGRIFEAHVNALHLIARHGSITQWHAAMAAIQDGGLFALWVTDPPDDKLRMNRIGNRITLTGGKQFCSGAGYATDVLVTAQDTDGGVRMLVLRLGIGETVRALPSPLQGMRAAVTGAVDFTGCETPASGVLGQAGDYLREPDFSAGAWRGSAVALGGLIALLDLAVAELQAAGRAGSPHAQARLGYAMIARETARLWVGAAARTAEDPNAETGRRVATVSLARIAVETACLDAMRLLQRSVGLSAFRQGNPIERICRDLSTYLRQPAPDEVLTEAARWFMDHPKVLEAE